jgi:predicted transposase YdaD
MRTDELYYQIFLNQPALLAELIPGLPADCAFEYVAPVVKESKFCLDGLLMPLTEDPSPSSSSKPKCSPIEPLARETRSIVKIIL